MLSRVASVATAYGSVEERLRYAVEELECSAPFDALIVSAVSPATGNLVPLLTRGHSRGSIEYFHSAAWRREAIEPFCFSRPSQPVRECDFPVDPLSLLGVAKFFREDGLLEGTIQLLATATGRATGLLTTSSADPRPLPDEDCRLLAHVAPVLANLLDPLQSAYALAATLDDECAVVLSDDGRYDVLYGDPPAAMLGPEHAVRREVDRAFDERLRSAAFLWPCSEAGWFLCRAWACRDGLRLLTLSRRDVHGLSRRELEVLAYLVAGLTNPAIAAELWVTTRTVRAHVERILEKLEVPTRAAAVARALREGIVLPDSVLPRQDVPFTGRGA